MQVSSSLIAAQAAAREAQARFHAHHSRIQNDQAATPSQAARPAAASGAADGFAPLPLKQIQTPASAPAQALAGAHAAAPARLGQHIDITI
jgi:hypothetical protein